MAKIDSKDAYFAVPISKPDKKYLRFGRGKETYMYLPTFWAVMRFLGLYQDNQGCDGGPKGDGHQNHSLHRRHVDYGRVGGSFGRSRNRNKEPTGKLRVCHQFPKVNTGAKEDDGVPQISSGLIFHGAQPSWKQNEEHQTGGREDLSIQGGHGTGSVTSLRQDEYI